MFLFIYATIYIILVIYLSILVLVAVLSRNSSLFAGGVGRQKTPKKLARDTFFSLFRQQKTLHTKSLILSDTITRARIKARELKPTDRNAEEEEEGETRFGRRRFRFRRAQTRVLVSFLIEKKQIFIAREQNARKIT